VKALKNFLYNLKFFRTLIYAGNISNALESVDPDNKSDSEKSQRQVINQQGIKEILLNKEFIE
jgi:hypothetical protein